MMNLKSEIDKLVMSSWAQRRISRPGMWSGWATQILRCAQD